MPKRPDRKAGAEPGFPRYADLSVDRVGKSLHERTCWRHVGWGF